MRLNKLKTSPERSAIYELKNPLHSAEYELGRIDKMILRKHDLHHVVFKEVIEGRNEDMGQPINGRIRVCMERDYRKELAKTTGRLLAWNYQKRMSYALKSFPEVNDCLYGSVLAMAKLSSNLIKDFAPYMVSFVLEVMRQCRIFSIRKLIVFSRDADVFYVIAKVFREYLFHEIDVKLEPITRRLFGIEDKPIGIDGRDYSNLIREVANIVSQEKSLLRYLKSVFGSENEVAILDSGVYGSIAGVIDYLHKMGYIKPRPYVFYFASRNPHIYGFVNQHLNVLPIPRVDEPCWLELFADTVEAFAKTHGSVEPMLIGNKLRFFAQPIKSPWYEASAWGKLVGIRDYTLYEFPKEQDGLNRPDLLIKKLYLSYQKAMEARVIPTLFLEDHAPPSPYGSAVLRGWDRGILPPQGFLLGYGDIHPDKTIPECKCYAVKHK